MGRDYDEVLVERCQGGDQSAFAELVEAGEYRPDIRIVLAQLGEQAGAVGAALLAREASS